MKAQKWPHDFSHYNPMGPRLLPWKPPKLDPDPCIFSPTPLILQIKFYFDWPTAVLRHIHVWRCKQTKRRTHGRSTARLVNFMYKINWLAFGSVELSLVMQFSLLWNNKIRISTTVSIWASLWENRFFAYAKTKTQISCAVTSQLISAFVFAMWIVQSLYYLNPKFQASSHLLWLYSLVCVGPGRKPEDRFSHNEAHFKGS